MGVHCPPGKEKGPGQKIVVSSCNRPFFGLKQVARQRPDSRGTNLAQSRGEHREAVEESVGAVQDRQYDQLEVHGVGAPRTVHIGIMPDRHAEQGVYRELDVY